LPQRAQDVSARDDAGDAVVAQDGDALPAAREQSLQLRERGLLVARGDTGAHEALDRRVRQAVRDRTVEVLAPDDALESLALGDEDPALGVALAGDEGAGNGLV